MLVVDKPAGLSSHDVVARVRRLAATKKVGHAGTLDPMATGVLVLGIGRATRLLTYLVGADKEYTATVRLGQATSTDDAAGEVTAAVGAHRILGGAGRVDTGALERALAALRGPIAQVPSAVSAIKVDGRRAYARARQGEEVVLPARPVTVHRLERTAPPRPAVADGVPVVDLDIWVACSSGTYVRALARDLGRALGTGGHLTALRRTRVGPFTLAGARTLPELAAAVAADAASPAPRGLAVMDLTTAARACFPVRQLTEAETRAVRVGQSLRTGSPAAEPPSGPGPGASPGADEAGTVPDGSTTVPDGSTTVPDAPTTVPPGPTAAPPRPTEQVTAALAPDGHVVALLARRADGARPVLVLDPA
ncbi:tRNA pseudouridine(55) synthase TruB [Georgenia sp. TF02-10]|nr:tRNA pseudouridine(55) synthase TruB [Georgenia sp. TF02-10]UNX56345.1 tRNA pseudouridine(55) synthase TruB [Georgenia sp. TF02-10]